MADGETIPATPAGGTHAAGSGTRDRSPDGQLDGQLAGQFAGLDALELAAARRQRRTARLWAASWPKLAAVAIVLACWQLVVASGWRPSYVLPGPQAALSELGRLLRTKQFWEAIGITMSRAGVGFGLAVVAGTLLGIVVSLSRPLRSAIGSLLAGILTMPSIAWFPLSILLFRLSESAILFVVVLGAAPAIAGGLLNGIDYIPPLLLRAGRTLGLRGWRLYRSVMVPAALPSYVAGLKQGWAFAWRALMAGELLVVIAHRPSIGFQLSQQQQYNDAAGMLAMMIVVLVLGIAVDSLFSAIDRTVRRRRGVAE